MKRIVRPAAGGLRGSLAVPGDKSIAHRALILGALAEGVFHLRNMPPGKDVASTRSCLETLGARVRGAGERLEVEGTGLDGLRFTGAPLDCGNSGTTMRLLSGVLSGRPGEAVLTGDASLSRRPMRRVAEPLERMGAVFTLEPGGLPPVRVRGREPLKALALTLALPSAQVKSAVLLAALFADGETALTDPFGTRDHTERMLSFLDGAISVAGPVIRLSPKPLRSGKSLTIPGDPSTAAFYAAAAALVRGSKVTLLRVLQNPTRMGFFSVLEEMGGRVTISPGGVNGREPVGDISVEHGGLKGIRIPAGRVPSLIDEVPLLAVLGAAAEGETRIEGLGELRVKESDRLSGTADGLRAMGAQAEVDGDDLLIRGSAPLRGAGINSLGDHRLAMAFSVAALAAEGESEIDGVESAAISHPAFFADLDRLMGARA